MGLRWQWGYIREQLQALEVVISFNTCGQPGCIRQGRINMELTGRSKIGRPQRRCMQELEKGMQGADLIEEDARDGARWRQMICSGNP